MHTKFLRKKTDFVSNTFLDKKDILVFLMMFISGF